MSISLKQYLVKSISGIFIIRVISVVLGIVASVVFARIMGPDEFGCYSYVIETALFISIPVALGLPQLLTREISKYNTSKDYLRVNGLLRWSVFFSLFAAVVLILSTWFIIKIFVDDPYTRLLFYFALPIIALRGIGQVRMGALMGFRQPVKAQLPDHVFREGVTILFIGVLFYLFRIDIDAKIAIIAMDISLFIGFILGIYWLLKAIPNNVKLLLSYKYENKYWAKETIPFFFLGGIAIINSRLSMVLSGVYLLSAEVGFYKIALTASTLVSFFLMAINSTISPLISEMYQSKQYERLQRLLTVTVRIIFSSSLVVTLFYIYFGKKIITLLYGAEYLNAYVPLVILTVGQLINSAAGSVGNVLSMTGHQKDTLIGQSISAIFNIVLCLVLIPRYGIIGAAISTSISLLIWNMILIILLKKRTSLKTTILS